eukprot:TRINITY_DN20039_c0_g1_i1.p1 TRINITY_DN20039_c0_g1~~TRINITY_DN20039_c0_g1_i1.p1  ORF type:complete len:556 (+),score=119.70 TRINITY_DN20039_c0_g1_i1:173-1840(+)
MYTMKGFRLLVLLLSIAPSASGHGDPQDAPLRISLSPPSWSTCPFACAECVIPASHQLLCANLTLPLDWARPDLPARINFHLSAFRLVDPSTREGSVWLLEGGPGGDGFEMLPAVSAWLPGMPTLDLILPDHRGTGFSDRLLCQESGLDIMICVNRTIAERGPDYLPNFNPTSAALDVVHAIAANAGPGEWAGVYGVSYGTKWTNRYLQIAPSQPSVVVLDGICASNLCRIQSYDQDLDSVGRDLFRMCEQDRECNRYLNGRFATRLAEDVFNALDDSTLRCNNEWHPSLDRASLGIVLTGMLSSWPRRVLVVPLLLRLARCSTTDKRELEHLLGRLTIPVVHSPMSHVTLPPAAVLREVGPSSTTVDFWSEPLPEMGSNFLGYNILFSEMFVPYWREEPYSDHQLAEQAAAQMFTTNRSLMLTQLQRVWPKYKPDQYTAKVASVPPGLPLIALNGDLDQATSYAWAVNYSLTVNKQLLTFKQAVHATALGGHTPVRQPGAMDCAAQIAVKFFNTRGAAPVLSLSLIHISEPTRLLSISYAVFCLKKKKKKQVSN